MSDEIDNIKMRARRTPPSMLELCEYYKKKQALTFGSKEHSDVEENQTGTATSKKQAQLRKRLLGSAAASSSSYEPSESSSSGHMSVHKSRIFSVVREDIPSFLEEACTNLPRVRARKVKIVAVNGRKDGKDEYPSFHSPESTSNKSVQMALCYTKTSNAKQDRYGGTFRRQGQHKCIQELARTTTTAGHDRCGVYWLHFPADPATHCGVTNVSTPDRTRATQQTGCQHRPPMWSTRNLSRTKKSRKSTAGCL